MFKCQINWSSKLPKLQGKEEEIISLHINDKIPINQLAQTYGCSRRPLIRIIENNGFKTRPSTSPELEGHEEEIIRMYVDDQLTIQTIRKKVGVTFNTIKGFLKRNNIKLRTADESRKTEDGKPKKIPQKLIDPKDLENAIKLYESGEVLEKIGEIYGISAVGLRIKFQKLGIRLRTPTESGNLEITHQRKRETFRKNYGVDNPMKDPNICEQSRTTTIEKYGHLNPDNENQFCRRAKNAFKYKTHTLNGKVFNGVQGYEPQAIEYLVNTLGYDVDDIESSKKIPKIRYIFNNKPSIYFPDLYIERDNLLIEVKCQYTYDKAISRNILKQQASKYAGYDHITIMFDPKGKKVIDIF
jgi:hypothetical protein